MNLKGSWRHVPSGLLYLALALQVTFPLWLHPASRIQSLGDPLLNSYILAWDRHAIFHQITDFFQANVFWPHEDALAYGEHLIAPALLVLPLSMFTSAAPALHNLSLIEGYFFCALAAHALAFYHFRSISAATVCGLLYGFAPYRIVQVGHVQLVHGEFLPLMVLGFELSLSSNQRWPKWLLGFAAMGQWLTSWYWAVFSFWCLAPYFAVRIHQHRNHPRKIVGAIVPLVIAAICVAPVAWPYAHLKSINVLFRPKIAAVGLSAEPADFIRPASRAWVSSRVTPFQSQGASERTLFPGFATCLGLIGALALFVRRNKQFRLQPDRGETDEAAFSPDLWFGITFMLLLFCFGSSTRIGGRSVTLPYTIIEQLFPFAGGIRAAARWMLPALLGMSLICAYAWKEWTAIQHNKPARVVGALFALVLIIECLASPLTFRDVETNPPPVFRELAKLTEITPILELPIHTASDNRSMLHATWHWQPVVNGNNGFYPPGQQALFRVLEGFPNAESLTALDGTRTRHVLIDTADALVSETLKDEAKLREEIEKLGTKCEIKKFEQYLLIELRP